MLKFSSQLRVYLNSAASQVDWAQRLKTMLGTSRRIRCFHDNNNQATDPATTGTEFLNFGVSGEMGLEGGKITNFGVASDVTIKQAADISEGKAVLRIEGDGHWVEGSLGLAGSVADFKLSANPTGSVSMGIAPSISMSAPHFLASGTGPVPPSLDATSPKSLRIDDWTDPLNPVTVGSLNFDTRDYNLVATDAEIAASMGDVRVTKSSQSVVFGKFEFGALLLSMNASCNNDANVPVHQVLVNCRPHGTVWAEKYPSYTGHDNVTDTTFPSPFKAYLLDGNGNILHIFHQRDGLPVNSPLMPQFRDATNALRPHFTCAEMLFWQSHEPKLNTKARKFFNGMKPDVLRPSICKTSDGSNAAIPLGTGTQFNGALQWNALPRWPMPRGARNAEDYPDAVDPYLYDADTATSASINQENRTSGWDYEIGSISGHDRFTGPGGIRPERCVFPPALTAYLTSPTGARLKGNVPYKDMMNAWNKAYFNQSRHFFRDVKSFDTIPQEEVFRNEWSHCRSYYGSNSSGYAPKVDNHISLFAVAASSSTTPVDKDGKRHWNGDAVDYMHAYSQSGWAALINNSPAHLVSHKQYVFSNMLAWFGGGRSVNDSYVSRFHSRQDAWHWLAMTMAWKLASDHPTLGIKRSVVEDRMQYNLNLLYNTVYVPSLTDQSLYFQALRNFGTPAEVLKDNSDIPSDLQAARTKNSSMAFYMAGVFSLMKTTGVWDRLWNMSAQNQTAMTFWVQCYDKYSLDFMLDTDIRSDYYMELTARVDKAATLPSLPANWAEWATTVRPKTGVEDWITNADGSPRSERDGNTHLRAQWAFMRRDFDLHVPNAKILPACEKYQGYYDLMESRVAAISGTKSQALKDWLLRWPGNGIIATPIEV